MPVVVAQHGEDRQCQVAARVGEHGGLLGLAVGREVAGEQQQVGALVEPGEGLAHARADRLVAVDVAGGGDAQRRRAGARAVGAPGLHGAVLPRAGAA